jgi:shikimate kinase
MNAQPPGPASRRRTIALVGLMGVGKSTVGRRLAVVLGMPFKDTDIEIERAAGRSVGELFAERGEAEFRDGERRVIARLLDEPAHVLATGGGAFMHAETRRLMKEKATSVWLQADLDTLVERVRRKDNRPLLRDRDPRLVLGELMAVRDPFYAEADIIIAAMEGPHERTVQAIVKALQERMETET